MSGMPNLTLRTFYLSFKMSQSAINFTNPEGKSALDLALENHEWEIAGILVNAGAKIVHPPKEDLLVSLMGYFPLEEKTHETLVQEILTTGIDVNQLFAGRTALMIACDEGYLKIVEKLLDAGANPDIRNEEGVTALMLACQREHLDIVNKLIEAGANVHLEDEDKDTALHYACSRSDKPEIVERLLVASSKVNHKNAKGLTPLMRVSKFGCKNAFDALIRYSADPNLQKKNGDTALILACKKFDQKIAELLVKIGADVNIQNKKGFTALSKLIEKGFHNKKDLVKLLLDNGSDVNLATNEGWTPLMFASADGIDGIVKLLVEHITTLKPEVEELSKETSTEDPEYRDYLPEVKLFKNSDKYYTWAWKENVDVILIRHGVSVYAIGKYNPSEDICLHPLYYLSDSDKTELSKFGITSKEVMSAGVCALEKFAEIHSRSGITFIVRE